MLNTSQLPKNVPKSAIYLAPVGFAASGTGLRLWYTRFIPNGWARMAKAVPMPPMPRIPRTLLSGSCPGGKSLRQFPARSEASARYAWRSVMRRSIIAIFAVALLTALGVWDTKIPISLDPLYLEEETEIKIFSTHPLLRPGGWGGW